MWASAEDGGVALWAGAPAVACTLRAVTEDWSFRESAPTAEFTATTESLDDPAFLDMIQRSTFRYFWQSAHPVSGLTRERSSSGDICATGGTGFGIMAIPVGIERGFITRAEGTARLLQVLTFLATTAERHWGAFPHWIHGVTGQHVGFLGPSDDTVDLVETSYLAEGLLTVRQYFDGAGADETQIRALATQLWEAIEWDAFIPAGQTVLRWHRSPTTGLSADNVSGWNECMITYLLAVASPTHPVATSLYHAGWARNGAMLLGQSYYGYPLYVGYAYGGPMFFAHYSFVGFDPRSKHDAYANYYTHNRNHALVQVAYGAANPLGRTGYSALAWGLTASDDPYGYSAHEAYSNDNGTLTPSAALSSMPYVPQQSLAAARYFYETYGATPVGLRGVPGRLPPRARVDRERLHRHRPGTDRADDREHPQRTAVEPLHGQPRDRAHADGPRVRGRHERRGRRAAGGRGAAAALRLAASPNPSAGAMSFVLELPTAGAADVEVFDLSGRRMAVTQHG